MANELPRPQKCITVEEARALENNWVDTRAGVLEKSLGFQDAREYSWTVEELQQYLDYVKSESQKQGINNPGIRVYLGAYPKKDDGSDRPSDLSTVFFAPTGSENGESNDNNYNIDPFNFGGVGWPPYKY